MARKKAEVVVASNKMSPLANVEKIIGKIFKGNDVIVQLDPEVLTESLPYYPSGSFVMDYLIGGKLNTHGVAPCPGFPGGRVTQLYGNPSSGKTTLALTTCGQVAAMGGCALYIDWENEVVPDYANQLGVPISDRSKFLLVQPDTLEDGMKIAWAAAASGVDLIVLDSVGAGVPKDVFEQKVEDQGKESRLALNASKWSAFLPKFKAVCKKSGTAVLGIAQIRANPGAMGHGDKTTVQGGNAWKFYAALRIKLSRISQLKAKRINPLTNAVEDVSVGGKIQARIEKCKVSSSQGAEQVFYIRWGTGIDNLASYIDVGAAHNVIKQSGSWYSMTLPDGSEFRCQGAEKFALQMGEDPKLLAAVHKQVVAALSQSSYQKSAPPADAEVDIEDALEGMPDMSDAPVDDKAEDEDEDEDED